MRLLVVDDSDLARMAAVRALSTLTADILALASAEAVEKVDASSLAGAVLDLEIGSVSGVDVALALRGRNEALAIAFLTAGASAAGSPEGREIGPVFRKDGRHRGRRALGERDPRRAPLIDGSRALLKT